MKSPFAAIALALAALALSSCATPPPAAKGSAEALTRLRISNTPYELDLKPGHYVGSLGGTLPKDMSQYGIRMQTTSVYTLIDTRTGKTVGQAESAYTKADITAGVLLSDRRVEVSPDGRQILVQDDIAGSYPSRRYILFEQKPDGAFATFYLAPPTNSIPATQVVRGNYTLPWIHFNDPDFATYPRFTIPFNR